MVDSIVSKVVHAFIKYYIIVCVQNILKINVVTSRSFPAACPYNAPVLAVPTLNMMAAQSVSIDKYQEGDQQVDMIQLMFYCLVLSISIIHFAVPFLFFFFLNQ